MCQSANSTVWQAAHVIDGLITVSVAIGFHPGVRQRHGPRRKHWHLAGVAWAVADGRRRCGPLGQALLSGFAQRFVIVFRRQEAIGGDVPAGWCVSVA